MVSEESMSTKTSALPMITVTLLVPVGPSPLASYTTSEIDYPSSGYGDLQLLDYIACTTTSSVACVAWKTVSFAYLACVISYQSAADT